MITVTGTILDSHDNPLHALITFTPTSTPYIKTGGGLITSNPIQLKSNAADGTFSVTLEAGAYMVTIAANPSININIVIPNSGGPYTIDQLTSLPAPTPYVASGSGSPEGVVTGAVGLFYTDFTNGAFYIKLSGTGNTGWQKFIQL